MAYKCLNIEEKLQPGERLTTVAEAKADFQRIRDNCLRDSKEKVRLKNGYLEAGKVKRGYEPFIRKKLVTSSSSSSSYAQTGNMEDADYLTALIYASVNDDVGEVEELAQVPGPHILGRELPMYFSGTVLHVCIEWGSINILEKLLNHHLVHLRQDILDDDGDTPIHNLPNMKLGYEMYQKIARLILGNDEGFHMLSKRNRFKFGTPLCKALIYEEKDACKALLDVAAEEFERGISEKEHWLGVTAYKGNTALHLAAANGYVDIVEGILAYPETDGLNPCSKKNKDGNTPLHIAACEGHLLICSKLLEHREASPEVTNNNGETAMNIALRQGNINLDVAGLMFRTYEVTESSVNESLGSGLTPLHVAVATSSSVDRIHECLKAGAFVDARSDDGQTPLHIASARLSTNMGAFSFLLAKSRLVKMNFSTERMDREKWLNMRDFSGKTALHYAVTISKGHLDEDEFESAVLSVSDILCHQESARVDFKDSKGQTPLHIAAKKGHFLWVECLLKIELTNEHRRLSKDINRDQWIAMCDFSGETALHEAVKRRHKPIVKLLLERTSNANGLLRVRDIENRTALHWAVQQKDEEIISTMLKFADLRTERFLMWNAISNAHETPEVLKRQIETVKTQRMETLLEDAVRTEDLDTARELINGGADVTSLQGESRLWLTRNFCSKASDQPTLEDSLGRRRLVEGIAALLLNPYTGTPVTIGIFGEWGTGKSSLMLQVEETLLYMTVKETFKNTHTHSEDLQALLGDEFKFSSAGKALRSEAIMAFKKRIESGERKGDVIDKSSLELEDDIIDQFPTKLLSEHRLLFKALALTDRTKLVKFSGEQGKGKVLTTDQMLKEAQVTGHAPAVLTVRYNAWHYENKTQASAGLAVEISRELESFMTPPQWLRMYWQYSWKTKPKDIFVGLLLPMFLIIAAACIAFLLWEVAPIRPKFKFLTLPIGVLGVIWALFRSFLQVVQPVTQTILQYITSPDHESMLGYQQQVISDLNFLKEQLCREANLWWTFLGLLGHVFISKSYYMKDTYVKKQHPRLNNLRIVVFIDDLDRCDEKTILEVVNYISHPRSFFAAHITATFYWEETNFILVLVLFLVPLKLNVLFCDLWMQLLRAINLILGVSGINVVIGVDKGMVERAVTKEFLKEDMLPDKAKNDEEDALIKGKISYTRDLAEKYLQKIIQLPVQMAEPSRDDIRNFIEGQIGRRQLPKHKPDIKKNKNQQEEGSGVVNSENQHRIHIMDAHVNLAPGRRPSKDAAGKKDTQGEIVEDSECDSDVSETKEREEEDPDFEENEETGALVAAPRAVRPLLASYSPMESDLLRKLCGLASGDRKFPREWKRFLNYHRLVWTILSLDDDLKESIYKGWQRKLILWIFLCWNFREQMDVIIQSWKDLLSKTRKVRGVCQLGDMIGVYMENKGWKRKDEIDKIDPKSKQWSKKEEMNRARDWISLYNTLKREYDLRMHFIQIFQQFRFYCELHHLEIRHA